MALPVGFQFARIVTTLTKLPRKNNATQLSNEDQDAQPAGHDTGREARSGAEAGSGQPGATDAGGAAISGATGQEARKRWNNGDSECSTN